MESEGAAMIDAAKQHSGDIAGWITVLSWAVIAIGVLSAVAVAIDIARGRKQAAPLMNPAYVVNATYLGIFLLPFYFGWLRKKNRRQLAEDRSALVRAGLDHETADKRANEELDGPMWVKILRTNSHHAWTCWVGDIIGAWLVFFFGWKIAGKMPAGKAVGTALVAEFVSVSVMMFTLFAWMAAIQLWWFDPPIATNTAAFWGINMIPGMILGYIASYPATYLLMKVGLKESM